MTQANNRQGADWTKAPGDGDRPRPGTESNRARAARGGFTFTMPSEPGTVIARLDTTGPEPVGSVSRDGGQTWEDAPRWPAPLDVLPGVVVMSAWRRPDGALVAEGSDGVDRVTKPGEIRTPEDADRMFGVGFGLGRWMRQNAGAAVFRVDDLTPGADGPLQHGRPISGHREMVAAYGGTGRCPTPEEAEQLYGRGSLPPMTWGGVPVPFERVDTARARTAPQPDPAPGQVWLPPPVTNRAIPLDADGTVTVSAIQDYGHWVAFAGGGGIEQCEMTMGAHGWTCIGVATPHGRVMVGDAFRPDADAPEWTVTAVGYPPGSVVLSRPDAGSCSNDAAHVAARWTRTRYAPARAGERYASRLTPGRIARIDRSIKDPSRLVACVEDPGRHSGPVFYLDEMGGRMPAEQWERLDVGQGSDALSVGQTIRIKRPAFVVEAERARAVGAADAGQSTHITPGDHAGSGRGSVVSHPRCRSVTIPITQAMRDTAALKLGAPSTLTLQAPAPDLRALFDAIGRALELPATRHACPFGAGLTVTVLRDEMLFTPTAETGIGTADLAGDARGLCALRACVQEAMATGRASLPRWGAKGPRVEVVREGGPAMGATTASEPAEPVRYQPSEGGADQWRWGV